VKPQLALTSQDGNEQGIREMLGGAGRMTATARADIGARCQKPDREAWVRELRADV
jgi:hypothetical protein